MSENIKRGGGMFNPTMGPGMPGGQPQMPLNVDLSQCPEVICPKCKGRTWDFTQMVRKVPKLLSGGQGPDRIFMQVMQCNNFDCKHILTPEEFEAVK